MTTLAGIQIFITSWDTSQPQTIEIRGRAGSAAKVVSISAGEFTLDLDIRLIAYDIYSLDDVRHNFLAAMENARRNGITVELGGWNNDFNGYYYVSDVRAGQQQGQVAAVDVSVSLVRADFPGGTS